MILCLSSTAIVMQTLEEKGLRAPTGGRASFAVLLFQDIAVIPLLALIPLLGCGRGAAEEGDARRRRGARGRRRLGCKALVVLGGVALVILGGRYLTRPLFRFIAHGAAARDLHRGGAAVRGRRSRC